MICFLCADESRSCLLLCARRVHVCAVLVRLLVCIVFINTSYEEKIPKHGHGEVPVAAAVRLLARGGPCGRCCCAGWLPCIPPPAWPPGRAELNAEPSNTGRRAQVQPGHGQLQGRAGALAGQLGACRCRWRPGPGRNSSEACAEVGAVESKPRVRSASQ